MRHRRATAVTTAGAIIVTALLLGALVAATGCDRGSGSSNGKSPAASATPSPGETYVDEARGYSIVVDPRFERLGDEDRDPSRKRTLVQWVYTVGEASESAEPPLIGITVADKGKAPESADDILPDTEQVARAVLTDEGTVESSEPTTMDERGALEFTGTIPAPSGTPFRVRGSMCAAVRDGRALLYFVVCSATKAAWDENEPAFDAAIDSFTFLDD